MATVFSFGDATMYVSALLNGSGLEASARPVAPVHVHLHVYEFCDGGLSLACPPEFTDFNMYLSHLVDPRARDNMVPEILSKTGYDDLDTQWFLQEKLNEYVLDVGLNAFRAGVVELEITVEVHIHNMARRWRTVEMHIHNMARRWRTVEMHIHNMARRWREVEEGMAELIRYIEEGIGGEFGGVPASEASVRELEVVKYNGGGAEFEENECSICLEEFEVEMEVTRMPCMHVFHGGCLTRWLERSHHCPLCRHEMPI